MTAINLELTAVLRTHALNLNNIFFPTWRQQGLDIGIIMTFLSGYVKLVKQLLLFQIQLSQNKHYHSFGLMFLSTW